jgi:hypothetical protein
VRNKDHPRHRQDTATGSPRFNTYPGATCIPGSSQHRDWPAAAPLFPWVNFELFSRRVSIYFTIFGFSSVSNWAGARMIYKGVEYTLTPVSPGVWRWQFRIGDKVVSGKTEARLNLLAIRRVQLRIDRQLKKAARDP